MRALTELALVGGDAPVPIGEIAKRREIPAQFLESLFATLRRGGLLQSTRGVKGGYSFARPPAEITVLDVVELLEGDLSAEAAQMGGVWASGAEALRGVLAGMTIAEIAERESREQGAAMYYI